jgi:hypothetical protein
VSYIFLVLCVAADEVKIGRAEHLRLPRVLDSQRVERLRLFRKRFKEFEAPSPTVSEEAVIVTLREKREGLVDTHRVEWYDEFTTDHRHADIVRFKDLIDHKKSLGKEITVKDGVLAYLLVWGQGRKSTIAGFLWAISDDYPDFRYTHEEVRTTETVISLTGEKQEKPVVKRVRKELANADQLASVVGQALSRLRAEGSINAEV